MIEEIKDFSHKILLKPFPKEEFVHFTGII